MASMQSNTMSQPTPTRGLHYQSSVESHSDAKAQATAEVRAMAEKALQQGEVLALMVEDADSVRLKCFKCGCDQPTVWKDNGWGLTGTLGLFLCCFACPGLWLDYVTPASVHDKTFYCATCATMLGRLDCRKKEFVPRDTSQRLLSNAHRDGVFVRNDYRTLPDFERRNRIRSVTTFYNGATVTAFNSQHPYAAQNRIKSLEHKSDRANHVEAATDYLFEFLDCCRQDHTQVAGDDVRNQWKYITAPHWQLQEFGEAAVHASKDVNVQDPDWDTKPDQLWRPIFRDMLFRTLTYNHTAGPEFEKRVADVDCYYAMIIARRGLDKMQLTPQEDDRRCAAVELALNYIQFYEESHKSWNSSTNHQKLLEEWWRRQQQQALSNPTMSAGTLLTDINTQDDIIDFINPLAAELSLWHPRASIMRALLYFVHQELGLNDRRAMLIAIEQITWMWYISQQKLPDNFSFTDLCYLGKPWPIVPGESA